jgi:hypothetical protein
MGCSSLLWMCELCQEGGGDNERCSYQRFGLKGYI